MKVYKVTDRPVSRSLWCRRAIYRCTAHHIIQQTVPLRHYFCANCLTTAITFVKFFQRFTVVQFVQLIQFGLNVKKQLLVTLMFLLPTNALLYYTYKMLKYTVKTSHYCSYMFRSIRTIIRESQTARHTVHTTTGNTFTNTAEHLTTYL